jgi:tRNA dimethylallyltransferase
MTTVRLTDEELRLRPVVAVIGPTAVGKSEIAIQIANALGSDILTADSRQVYRGMDIGTDKPSVADRLGVTHRLIDLVEPDQPFNAGMFRRQAIVEIDRLYRERKLPLVVGGTGLYVRVLLHGLWPGPAADWSMRAGLEQEARERGADYLHRALALVDPGLAARLHPHDRVKIIRALEVYRLSGRPLSEAHGQHRFEESTFRPLVIGLLRERDVLYERIEARVEAQLQKGLLRETRRLLEMGYPRQLGSMKGLGYRQIAGHLSGEYDYDEAVRRLKRDTRRFAKRQLTWFRREPGVRWLSIGESESTEAITSRVLAEIERFLTELRADKLTNGQADMRSEFVTCKPVSLSCQQG